jgi:hypothetical protein
MQDAELRLAVYERILTTGRVPTIAALATHTGTPREDIHAILQRLQAIHAFALTPGSGEILMAHPFSAVPTPYTVRTRTLSFWANCAWDALAIPPLLGVDASVQTRCADCADPLSFIFSGGDLRTDGGVVHFAVPPRRFWDNVAFT